MLMSTNKKELSKTSEIDDEVDIIDIFNVEKLADI